MRLKIEIKNLRPIYDDLDGKVIRKINKALIHKTFAINLTKKLQQILQDGNDQIGFKNKRFACDLLIQSSIVDNEVDIILAIKDRLKPYGINGNRRWDMYNPQQLSDGIVSSITKGLETVLSSSAKIRFANDEFQFNIIIYPR